LDLAAPTFLALRVAICSLSPPGTLAATISGRQGFLMPLQPRPAPQERDLGLLWAAREGA
jgi:hypothetical protein